MCVHSRPVVQYSMPGPNRIQDLGRPILNALWEFRPEAGPLGVFDRRIYVHYYQPVTQALTLGCLTKRVREWLPKRELSRGPPQVGGAVGLSLN